MYYFTSIFQYRCGKGQKLVVNSWVHLRYIIISIHQVAIGKFNI